MNFEALNDLFNKHGVSAEDVAYLNFGEIENQKDVIGPRKIVHEQGDSEGGGSHSEKVIYFEKFDCYVSVTGYYTSYDGTDWDSWKQVFPKEKTITVYE